MSPAGRAPYVLIMFSALLLAAATLRMAQADPAATASQWLEKVALPGEHRPRERGCWRRPWVCGLEETAGGGSGWWFPPAWGWQKMCCNNRCVDVSGGDANNCGACGVRCPFSWTCCGGVCVDPNTNPFHCGACNNRCAFGSLCAHGMCGYAQYPSFPFPHHDPAFPAPLPRDGGASLLPPPQKYYHSRP